MVAGIIGRGAPVDADGVMDFRPRQARVGMGRGP